VQKSKQKTKQKSAKQINLNSKNQLNCSWTLSIEEGRKVAVRRTLNAALDEPPFPPFTVEAFVVIVLPVGVTKEISTWSSFQFKQ